MCCYRCPCLQPAAPALSLPLCPILTRPFPPLPRLPQAYVARFNGGGESQVAATPVATCSPAVLPSAPTSLVATPGNGNVSLCWTPPTNQGCVDEWRVAIRVAQQDAQRSSPTQYRRYNSPACVVISQLTNGVLYQFSVQGVLLDSGRVSLGAWWQVPARLPPPSTPSLPSLQPLQPTATAGPEAATHPCWQHPWHPSSSGPACLCRPTTRCVLPPLLAAVRP